jgi:diguanylate cyclase (GGDEF)-like protein
LLLAIIAAWGTVHGFGPFARSDPNESLVLTQAYICVAAVSTLVLATVVAERTSVEVQLRHLSLTDPLTGLANYRLLMDRLQREVIRSERTRRPFSVVLFDVDKMKQINDEHGHVVGSRALCRVANALRASSRAVDTAARYGGDEFVLLMPESDAAVAAGIADRVAETLAGDRGAAPVTVSIGAATYPADGTSVEALLEAADRALYRMKAGDVDRIAF